MSVRNFYGVAYFVNPAYLKLVSTLLGVTIAHFVYIKTTNFGPVCAYRRRNV